MLVGNLVDALEQRDQLGALGFAGLVERLRRRVQELVGEAARERLQHLLGRRAAHQQPAGALELLARGLTNKFLHLPTQALNQAGDAERAELVALFQRIYHIADGS